MKIIVAYKGTNVGRALLDIAVKHANAFNGSICIVSSLPGGESTELKAIQEAGKNLDKAKEYIKEQGIDSEVHLLIRGLEPGEDILKFAEQNKADEIIIGVKSRSKVGKLVFGSNAQTVILGAHCPVLAVK